VKQVKHPVNVVCLSKEGKAVNHGCAGPEQLRTWLAEGRVKDSSQVFVEKTQSWMNTIAYLQWCERKSDTEQLFDMDATLTNLLSVAEELKKVSGGYPSVSPGPRDFREHWKAVCSDGDIDDDDDDDSATIRSTVAGVGAY